MVCFHLIAFVCWTFVWSSNGGYSDNSSDIFISFTSTSDIKLVNTYPGIGEFAPYATVFKDTTQESATSDSLYYFISDGGDFTDRSEWPVLMMSTIYDSNANVFSNDENVISAQIPYQVFAANQSYSGDGTQGNGLLSCTNGNTFDIIMCYTIEENLNPMVYCLIFFNNYLTPKWSNPIPVINHTIPIDPSQFTLECVHDGYLILFQALTLIENDKPNTLYTLLDLNGNFVMYALFLFSIFYSFFFFALGVVELLNSFKCLLVSMTRCARIDKQHRKLKKENKSHKKTKPSDVTTISRETQNTPKHKKNNYI